MRALVATEPGKLELDLNAPEPRAGRGQVVVAVEACGICGGDVDDFLDADNAPSNLPLIPGHEAWGRVVEVGEGVPRSMLEVPVAIDPSLLCGQCRPCREGRGNVCLDRGALGVTVPGGWAEYVAAPAANLYPLQDERLRGRVPVLVEPMACALYGIRRLAPRAGQEALVFGAGTMGLLLALLLEDSGVTSITIVDPSPARRARLRQLTAAGSAADVDELGDLVAPLVIDASGNVQAIAACLDRVDRSGTVLLFGLAPRAATIALAPYALLKRDVSIVTAFAIRNTFADAVETVARLAPALEGIVTHDFVLDEHEEAFAVLHDGTGLKVALRPRS